MLWPLERAVHSRDVEQRLLQLQTQLWRMERMTIPNPVGHYPVSNNFPLPPLPPDGCSTVCIEGTPTIPLGGGYAFRRLSILGANASAIVYLDWDGSAWISGTIPLITPLVCSGQSINLRWKMTAAGIGVGDVTLVLQYQVPIVGPAWNDGPTWSNTVVWNTMCGLSFTGGADFDTGTCNQSTPTDVCVNPVNLCDGEAATFFATTRTLTLTVSGISNGTEAGCGFYNRSWSLTYGAHPGTAYSLWREQFTSGVNDYYAVVDWANPTSLSLSFIKKTPSLQFRVSPLYSALKCDALIPGVTTFTGGSGVGYCVGWPATIDVTVT